MVPAPVVLHLHGEARVEGVVGVAGDAHIVIPIQAEAGSKGLRGVFHAFIRECLRRSADIRIDDALQALLPLVGDRLALALGHSIYVGFHDFEELVEVGQRVANQRAGLSHSRLGYDTVVLDDEQHVAGTAALRELAVAVHTHLEFGALYIVLVGDEHLGQVIGLACGLENLRLEEAQRAVGPACAAAVLVLDTGDGQLLHDGEDGLVGFLFLLLFLSCEGWGNNECRQKNCK